MEEAPVKLEVWDKEDPLRPLAADLFERISPLVMCALEEGGDAFKVFMDGNESSHIADVSISRRPEKKTSPRLERLKSAVIESFRKPVTILGRLKRALAWSVSYRTGALIVSIAREPEPDFPADGYALYIRVENCPEIEDTVVAVCNEHKENFKGGISIYSERVQIVLSGEAEASVAKEAV